MGNGWSLQLIWLPPPDQRLQFNGITGTVARRRLANDRFWREADTGLTWAEWPPPKANIRSRTKISDFALGLPCQFGCAGNAQVQPKPKRW
jgi:hypothetical protein